MRYNTPRGSNLRGVSARHSRVTELASDDRYSSLARLRAVGYWGCRRSAPCSKPPISSVAQAWHARRVSPSNPAPVVPVNKSAAFGSFWEGYLHVARQSGWETSDNQNENLASRHWHHYRAVIVAQGGDRAFGCRGATIRRWPRLSRGSAVGHGLACVRARRAGGSSRRLSQRSWHDEPGGRRPRPSLPGPEDLAPFAERLVGRDEEGSSLVAGADQLKERTGFSLIFGDVGEVIQDQQVVFVELGNGGFEGELAAGNLQPLDEIGGAGEQHAPTVFDKGEAKCCCEMALARPVVQTTVNWRRCSTMRRRQPVP